MPRLLRECKIGPPRRLVVKMRNATSPSVKPGNTAIGSDPVSKVIRRNRDVEPRLRRANRLFTARYRDIGNLMWDWLRDEPETHAIRSP